MPHFASFRPLRKCLEQGQSYCIQNGVLAVLSAKGPILHVLFWGITNWIIKARPVTGQDS